MRGSALSGHDLYIARFEKHTEVHGTAVRAVNVAPALLPM